MWVDYLLIRAGTAPRRLDTARPRREVFAPAAAMLDAPDRGDIA